MSRRYRVNHRLEALTPSRSRRRKTRLTSCSRDPINQRRVSWFSTSNPAFWTQFRKAEGLRPRCQARALLQQRRAFRLLPPGADQPGALEEPDEGGRADVHDAQGVESDR